MHLVCDISGHGFGHLAQAGPVLRALARRRPDLRLTLRSEVPAAKLASMLDGIPFATAPAPADPGMAMHDPVRVDAPASVTAYQVLHLDWASTVGWERDRLQALAPDLLLAAVPYTSLAAARDLGVPGVALSSLHWDGVLAAYGGDPELCADIAGAYAAADLFLQATPHMPMTHLANRRAVGPIARRGHDRGAELRETPDQTLVLASFGGIPNGPAFDALPALPGVRWLTADDHPDIPFIDLLASSDAVVTKLGYGMLVEAACNATRVLYVRRPDWPEQEPLAAWLQTHATAQDIGLADLAPERLAGPLRVLLGRPVKPPVEPTGADEAADAILALVD